MKKLLFWAIHQINFLSWNRHRSGPVQTHSIVYIVTSCSSKFSILLFCKRRYLQSAESFLTCPTFVRCCESKCSNHSENNRSCVDVAKRRRFTCNKSQIFQLVNAFFHFTVRKLIFDERFAFAALVVNTFK